MAAWAFGVPVFDKLVGPCMPVRFVIFGTVGATAIVAHMVTLWLVGAAGAGFAVAQTAAVSVAPGRSFTMSSVCICTWRRGNRP